MNKGKCYMNLGIPVPLHDKLEKTAKDTGKSKTHIVLKSLEKYLRTNSNKVNTINKK